MKIGHSADKPVAAPTTTNAAAPAQQAVQAQPAAADASAKIELSSSATSLLSGGVGAEFDAEKVARISKSIEDGTFKINPEAIADKLIANAREALSKVQS